MLASILVLTSQVVLISHRRIHIAQDRNDVFVTIAEYDGSYLDYLNNKTSSSHSFLRMHQYGPWNTLNASDVRDLGAVLLAISLRADAENK